MGGRETQPAPKVEGAIEGPIEVAGRWCWRAARPGAEARFVGGGEARSIAAAVVAAGGPALEASWLRQVHSGRTVEARAGESGQADAFWTRRPERALVVATADCLPVLLAGDGLVAAAHAGWRGLVRGVIPGLIAQLPAPPATLTAWIGPAIGGCCYEVGDEVAAQVVATSGPEALLARPGRRPHLDLVAAARRQLLAAGVERLEVAASCTRCDRRHLASYRRDGDDAGRNLALIWRPAGG